MTIIYADLDIGNDANDGLSRESPKRTASAAYALVTDGGGVCLTTPNGHYAEDNNAGHLYFNKAGLTAGIFIFSDDPDRPASLSGIDSVFSVRIGSTGHVFCDVNFRSCKSCVYGPVACVDGTATNLTFNRCKAINCHPSATFCSVLNAVTGTLMLNDFSIVNQSKAANGLWVDKAAVKIFGSKIKQNPLAGGNALLVGDQCPSLEVIDSEITGGVGVYTNRLNIPEATYRFIDSKVQGAIAAGRFNGAYDGNYLRVVTRGCRSIGTGNATGWLLAGPNCEIDEDGSIFHAGNVALGMPADGDIPNARGQASNFIAYVYDPTTGHGLLCGDGSDNSEITNGRVISRRSRYGLVLKGTGKGRDMYVEGGTTATALFKNTKGWNLELSELVGNDNGPMIIMGQPTYKAEDNSITDCLLRCLNGTVFYASSDPDIQENNTVDRNVYDVAANASWGTVASLAVESLDDVRLAWNNDMESIVGAGKQVHTTKASVRAGIAGRWKNLGTGPDFDDVGVEDPPQVEDTPE